MFSKQLRMKKILFIGASGMLGRPVARKLITAGFDVTLMGRNTEKLQKLFPEVKTIRGDVFDSASLEAAMKDQEIVYANLSVAQSSTDNEKQQEREGVDNIIESAKRAGIKRISYLSSLIKNYQGMNGFDWWAFRIKQSAADKIKTCGIPYTVFYPSTFMETFPFQMIRGHNIMLLGKSEAPMWFIAAEDYARQVAAAFSNDNTAGKEYVIQGPEPFTFDEAAKVIMKNHKKAKLKIMKAPIGIVKFLGRFVPKLNYGANICEALNKYPEKFESEPAWQQLGKPSITLAGFAKSF